MKQTLPEYIKQNEDLRKVLLSQEGGIMKYLAENVDANGTAELFTDYQNHCVDIFFEKNKWVYYKVWEGDDIRRAALGEVEHLWKEVNYYTALKPQLAKMESEVIEKIDWFVDLYLTYAYRLDRKRRFPKGQTDTEVYQEVIGMYDTLGLAYKCMEIILKEHHAQEEVEKSESELFTEFLIRQYSKQLTLGALSQIRQAVSEMLIGKTPEQCRQMAIDMMKEVRGFSQMIYTDEVVNSLRTQNKLMAEQRENDGKWLRNVADRTVLEEFSAKVKTHSMRYYFADFVNLLKDVGRIWAAQLLVRGIDMKVLEKGVCCILKPSDEPHYYVDRFYSVDNRGDCCIYSLSEAKKLLARIKDLELTWDNEKECFKNAVLKVMELQNKDGDYIFEKPTQWIAVYRFAVDKGIMYDIDDPNAPEDNSDPQYMIFENFAKELQLDVNPPIRLPFKKSAIDSINKKNYVRYNKRYPWSKEGIDNQRSLDLYKELVDVYRALEEVYYKNISQAERSND